MQGDRWKLPEKDIWMTGLFFSFLNLSRAAENTLCTGRYEETAGNIFWKDAFIQRRTGKRRVDQTKQLFSVAVRIIFRKGNGGCRCVGLAAEAGRRKKLWTFHFMPGIQKRSGAGTCSGRVCRNSAGTDP